MPDSRIVLPGRPKRIGVAADHGGFESRSIFAWMLREAHYEMVDYGDNQPKAGDDYPDYVVPWPVQ
jgi:ribose 5-phosphate isomerase B